MLRTGSWLIVSQIKTIQIRTHVRPGDFALVRTLLCARAEFAYSPSKLSTTAVKHEPMTLALQC